MSVTSCNRYRLYAEGAQLGAPDVQYVAARFHLILNLSTAIERALEEPSSQLRLPGSEFGGAPTTEGVPPKLTWREILKQQHRQRRLELYEKIMQLRGK